MAYCLETLGGISVGCESSLGGIRAVYIAKYEDVSAVSVDTEDGSTPDNPDVTYGMITGISMNGGAKFYKYTFRKETGSMESTLTVNEQAGTNFVTTNINLVFSKMETKKRTEIAALSIGQLSVIVEDMNGKYWLVGAPEDEYVSASAATAATGTAKGDANAYNITLTGAGASYPKEVLKSAVDEVVAETTA